MIKLKMAAVCMLFALLSMVAAKGNIISYQKTSDGVSFTLDKGKMFIGIVGDDVIEVKYTHLSIMPHKKSFVVPKPVGFKRSFSVSETPDAILIRTGRLNIKVDRKSPGNT
jgi:alpha-D-xyloside xylohydrolase